MSRRTVGLIIAGVAALAAVLTAIVTLTHKNSSSNSGNNASGSKNSAGISVGGSAGGCYAAGQNAVVNCAPPAPVNPTAPDPSIAASISRDASPAGSGPWAFTVLFDEVGGKPLGLFIRSSPEKAGFHLGLAEHLTAVWVDCVKTNQFDPDPGTGGGPRWYKVHWPSNVRSDAVLQSSPSDPAQGWAYAYYLRPNGTNGHVPACK